MMGYQYESDDHYNECLNERCHISVHGDYLRVQYDEHPAYIYHLMQPGAALHPFTDTIGYEGKQYSLAWIEDEREYGTMKA